MSTAAAETASGVAMAHAWREDFPILRIEVNGKPLTYLDNAATTQKPAVVIEAVDRYYRTINANVHRGVHTLSQQATEAYEGARETVRAFLNAESVSEIIFTSGTTDAINLVAQSFGRSRISAGDEILVTEIEHHSNIVPWQMLCEETGAVLKVARMNERGEIPLETFKAGLSEKTRLVGITHVSNALGTINPVKAMTELAHAAGARVLLDGAQAVAHMTIDVRELGCDFYAFSGHKLYGPTGIGVLYGKADLLDAMPPWKGGGDMIKVVSFSGTEYNELPYKFEAGTPNIAGAIGLGAACDYLTAQDRAAVYAHETGLLAYATERAAVVDGMRLVGTAADKCCVLSFTQEGAHPTDLGTLLDGFGVAIRTGHHCAMPVMERLGLAGTARASFALYNVREDVDRFFDALERARGMLL